MQSVSLLIHRPADSWTESLDPFQKACKRDKTETGRKPLKYGEFGLLKFATSSIVESK